MTPRSSWMGILHETGQLDWVIHPVVPEMVWRLKSALSHLDSATISNSANDCSQIVLGLVRGAASLLW